jgi:selenocysteine lyase/cysteine desulfurase
MTLASTPNLPVDFARCQFPALDGYWAFFDNAGGSQILQQVLDRINDYWLTTYVQLGLTISYPSGQGIALNQLARELPP